MSVSDSHEAEKVVWEYRGGDFKYEYNFKQLTDPLCL